MFDEISRATGNPAACQFCFQRGLSVGQRGGTCIPIALLQEVDDSCFVGAEGDGITPLAELLFKPGLGVLGLAPNPYWFVVTGKMDQLGVRWSKGLKARGQSGLLEYEVLHQAQHRGAVREVSRRAPSISAVADTQAPPARAARSIIVTRQPDCR